MCRATRCAARPPTTTGRSGTQGTAGRFTASRSPSPTVARGGVTVRRSPGMRGRHDRDRATRVFVPSCPRTELSGRPGRSTVLVDRCAKRLPSRPPAARPARRSAIPTRSNAGLGPSNGGWRNANRHAMPMPILVAALFRSTRDGRPRAGGPSTRPPRRSLRRIARHGPDERSATTPCAGPIEPC